MKRIHLTISGRVQGVYFRQSTRIKAEQLGVSGWVRNRTNGTVELVAEGPIESLNTLADWCLSGPELARVQSVERVDEVAAGIPDGFDVRPTV